MYWQKRFKREDPDRFFKNKILEIRKKHENYGYRRIHQELRRKGICINKKKVQRILQNLGLQVTSFGRKSRKYNSYKGKIGKTAPNRVHRRFDTSIAHQKITTDTTEFKYYERDKKGTLQTKKLYLDPFMDLYNREIISYQISSTPSAKGILKALNEAVERTKSWKYRRTFHSDQGWAYQMKDYVKTLKKNKIFQSMSRKGNCLDNSPMENFFGILKQEMYYGRIFKSYEELKREIEKYIRYYNYERIKEKLGWKSPVEYTEQLMAA